MRVRDRFSQKAFPLFLLTRLFPLFSLLLLTACISGQLVNGPTARPNYEPNWLRDPYVKFNRQVYLAAVGMGSSRTVAERNALGNLAAIFGQGIQVDERITTTYREAVRDGVTASWSEDTAIDRVIEISAVMDFLVGAEIRETWRDDRAEYYAVAVLNRARAIQHYSEIVRANQALINNLLDIQESERYSLESYARYQLAAIIADVSVSYANLLSVLGAPVQGLRRGDYYRLEARNIKREIPVDITVQNDRAGRIQGAFARAFSNQGFRSGGSQSRYVLDVDVNIKPVTFAGNPHSWTRIEVSANLLDRNSGTILLPFHFNSREGHTNQAEADNRAFAAAERRINEYFSRLLVDFLSRLMPVR